MSKPWSDLVADPKHGPLPALLLILTVVTGLVDAVSVLSLGRVFVANMTGNVVFVGFALAGAPGFSLSASLFALGGFLLGDRRSILQEAQAHPGPHPPPPAEGVAPTEAPIDEKTESSRVVSS